jgi:Tol biopolymer transport system component
VITVNRDGTREIVPVPPGRYRFPRFSPDGRKLAIVALAPRRIVGNVWTYDLETQRADQLTSDSSALLAEWAPGGRSVIFTGRKPGEGLREFQLFRVASSGGTTPETLFVTPRGVSTPALTPDGQTLVFSSMPDGNDWDVLAAPIADPGAAHPLANAESYNETAVSLSPDGRWVAYAANPGGTWQVYVRRLEPGPGRWLVSTNRGGTEPRWGMDGRELYYREGDSVRVVSFQATASEPVLGAPRALFEERYLGWPTEVHYDVTRDGQRFVFVSGSQGNVSLNLVLNRLDQLRSSR